MDDDGVEDLVDVRQRGDGDAHPVQGTGGRPPGLQLGVARAEGAGQGVDAAGRDDGERKPEDEDGRDHEQGVPGERERFVEDRVAQQLEAGDDRDRDWPEEPAEAPGSQELVHGVMHQLAGVTAGWRQHSRPADAGPLRLAGASGSRRCEDRAADRRGASTLSRGSSGPAPSPLNGIVPQRGHGSPARPWTPSGRSDPSPHPRGGRRSRTIDSRRSAASSTSRTGSTGESRASHGSRFFVLVSPPRPSPAGRGAPPRSSTAAREGRAAGGPPPRRRSLGEEVRTEAARAPGGAPRPACRTARRPAHRSRPRPRPGPRARGRPGPAGRRQRSPGR